MELTKRSIITEDFIIEKIVERKKFLELNLKHDKDDNTVIKGILKDNIDIFLRTYKVGDHVVCKAKVRSRGNEHVLEVFGINKFDFQQPVPEVHPKQDSEILIQKLDGYISNIKDIDYKKLLDNFFSNEDIRELFLETPGAKEKHHNYQYGLLQHSIEVTDISIFLANYFPPVNLDLLITCCLLHDVGKMKSYEFHNNVIEKTDWEFLLGHLSMSAIFISKLIPADFDQQKAKIIYHIILSHHKKLEWGSPIETKMKEAEILHFADFASSTFNHIDKLEFVGHWSRFDELTKKTWYRE